MQIAQMARDRENFAKWSYDTELGRIWREHRIRTIDARADEIDNKDFFNKLEEEYEWDESSFS